jgi:GMP synthase PP-ATPase subunit
VKRALANVPDKLVSQHPTIKEYIVKRVQTRFDNKQKDRFISELKKRNPETRAKYIAEQYRSLPDAEARRKFNVQMIEEKIITPDVMDALRLIAPSQ